MHRAQKRQNQCKSVWTTVEKALFSPGKKSVVVSIFVWIVVYPCSTSYNMYNITKSDHLCRNEIFSRIFICRQLFILFFFSKSLVFFSMYYLVITFSAPVRKLLTTIYFVHFSNWELRSWTKKYFRGKMVFSLGIFHFLIKTSLLWSLTKRICLSKLDARTFHLQ